MFRSLLFLAFLYILFSACNSEAKKQHQLIHKAEDILTEASEIYENTLKLVKADSLLSQNRAINTRLKQWNKNIGLIRIEDHDHGHDHNHNHEHHHHHGDSGLEITAEDRVIVLHELLDSIKSINKEVQGLSKTR